MMATNLTPKYDVEDFLRMMDAAKQEQGLKAQVGMMLDVEESRSGIISRLMDAAEESNQPLTEEEAGRAIDSFHAGLYTFKAPTGGTRLAEMYIDRTRILRKRIVPAGLGIALIGAGAAAVSTYIDFAEGRNERKVETMIESSYQTAQDISSDIALLEKKDLRDSLRPQLESIISTSRSDLQKTGGFFRDFCSDGTASDDVTPNNYHDAKERWKEIIPAVEAARDGIEKARDLFTLDNNLTMTETSIDSIMGAIRDDDPPAPLLERAKNLANAGKIGIDTNQLEDASGMLRQLQDLKKDIDEYSVLPGKIDTRYQSIRMIAKEQKAIELGDELRREAQTYKNSIDIDGLRDVDARLSEMEQTLNAEYSIRIVSREGVLSGFHRTYDQTGGKKWYVVVEAVDGNGMVMPRNILNQETGKTRSVTMYAEEVPESLFERVKADKLDDGIIDNDIFSKKPRGYLSERVQQEGLPERRGQITEW